MKIEKIINEYRGLLGENDYKFLKRVYSSNLETYINRLVNIGFEKHENILDAGCGFGQWSFSLAKLNKNVIATDISSTRLIIGNEIAKCNNYQNINFFQSEITKIPLENESIDAIFSYGVIFLVSIEKALKEFHRILKKGGKLYFNTNGLGWALNLWENQPNKTQDYNPKETAVKSFENSFLIETGNKKKPGQQICNRKEIITLIEEIGFNLIADDGDGLINIKSSENNIIPFFKKDYFGFEGVREYLIEKK